MVSHTSAPAPEETPHATETLHSSETKTQITISEALRRRAQTQINDIWIDRECRAVIRYALETNDPCLPDLVRRADAGEMIIDTIDFSQPPESNDDDLIEQKISALSEIICEAGDKPTAALFVLMGTLEQSAHPQVLANTAKHFAFARCADSNLYGIVDAQIDVVESELLTDIGVV
jgi:hypothetical protein